MGPAPESSKSRPSPQPITLGLANYRDTSELKYPKGKKKKKGGGREERKTGEREIIEKPLPLNSNVYSLKQKAFKVEKLEGFHSTFLISLDFKFRALQQKVDWVSIK